MRICSNTVDRMASRTTPSRTSQRILKVHRHSSADGAEQKGMSLIDRLINQWVVGGSGFICLHAANPAKCSCSLFSDGGFFPYHAPLLPQTVKTFELRHFQLVTLRLQCQLLKPLQQEGRGATAHAVKYFTRGSADNSDDNPAASLSEKKYIKNPEESLKFPPI